MSARQAWHSIKQRCSNPKVPQWKDYGGRGIKLHYGSFDEFLADVGERPAGMSIDRIDNDGHYEPGNVRWTSRKEQMRNRRNTVFLEIEGKRYRAADLAEQSGLTHQTIVARARRGLPMAEVLSTKRFRDLSGLALGGRVSGDKRLAKTHCAHGHEFTPENTYVSKEGWRYCRTCQNAKMRRLNAAKRLKAIGG